MTKKVSFAKENELIKLIDKYEKQFFNRKKVPVASETEALQLILIGQIWKLLNGYRK